MTITNKIEKKKMEITTKQKKTLVLKTGFMFLYAKYNFFFSIWFWGEMWSGHVFIRFHPSMTLLASNVQSESI